MESVVPVSVATDWERLSTVVVSLLMEVTIWKICSSRVSSRVPEPEDASGGGWWVPWTPDIASRSDPGGTVSITGGAGGRGVLCIARVCARLRVRIFSRNYVHSGASVMGGPRIVWSSGSSWRLPASSDSGLSACWRAYSTACSTRRRLSVSGSR